jgi:outer membrane cobalamin receptor
MKIHLILFIFSFHAIVNSALANLEYETTVTDKIIKHNQSIEVIQAKENESIQSILSRTAGIDFLAQGAKGRLNGLFFAGLASEHFSLLINGFPIHDLSAPSAGVNYSELDFTGQIEKIEIYRGGTAVRFGEQALGGIINIVLKEKSKNIMASLGSENYKSGSVNYSTGDFSIAANHNSIDGISDANEKYGNTEKDGNIKNSALVSYNHKINDERNLGLLYRHSSSTIDYDFFGGPGGDSLTSFYKTKTNQLALKSSAKNDQPYYSALLTENSRLDQNNAKFTSRYEQVSMGVMSLPFSAGSIFAEIQFESQTADISGSSFLSFSKRREQLSSALDYRKNFDMIYIGLGQRYFCRNQDSIKLSDISCLPATAAYAGWEKDSLSWLLTAQKSIRRASLFQLYSSIGSLNLKDEELSSVLLEVKPNFGHFSLFYHQLNNQIIYNTSYQNLAETKIYGLEFGYQYDVLEGLSLSQRYAYTRAYDVQNKRDLLRRSPFRLNSVISYELDEFVKFDLQHQYRVGALDINSDNVYITMPSTHNLSSAVHYKNSKQESYRLELNNILNDRTEQIWGYGVYGFNVQLVFSKSWM